jgi:hypothetical protein
MNNNPWTDLPENPPFSLPNDEVLVRQWNVRWGESHRYFVHDEFLPEPFTGLKDAPIVCLSIMPGCPEHGRARAMRNDVIFRKKMRQNLLHETLEYPFVMLDPGFAEHGNDWWEPKTKVLIAKFGRKVVARSLLNVVYFPYVTAKFGHSRLCLSSQAYSFGLVRRAVSRGAVVVLMYRGLERHWLAQVPELKGYRRFFRVSNPQNPAISPGNLGDDFQTVVDAIRDDDATA